MRWKTETVTGWGRALSATEQIARPEKRAGLAELAADTPCPAFGMRRSYGDACLNSGGKTVNMTRLDRLLSFDDASGVLEVEAGATLGDLARVFAPKGWLPPVMPGTGFATVGGAIAMDVHGKNHHGAGSFGQHLAAITLIAPGGKPRTITDKDKTLWRATIGGLGQTGVIASAKINMLRAKGDVMIVTERRISDWDEHIALLDASEATYTVGWVDATAKGAALGRGVLEEGETGSGLLPRKKGAKSVPFNAPGFALSGPVVRTFNAAYWRRVPVTGRTSVKPIGDFFFPLDRIHDWNRLYGKRGFHQFQCVVPLERANALRDMLATIAASGLASPLAVLKRMGAGRAGMMSFPMEGYTLAVDFPNRGGVSTLIAELEQAAADAGGRIYLAKDALATGETIRAMYPEHSAWAKACAKADPGGVLHTDLIRRLNLRST
ncbi:MAG: FAD-binding protein [Rhodobacteraceae bacterium]|nr:FAD-binding protein [Paracoccaceae bacterium]